MSHNIILMQYARIRISFFPVLPLGIFRWNLWEPSFEIFSLNTHQPFFVRIPERSGFFVIQYKCALISPAGGDQRQLSTVYFAAVHSRQINKGSISRRNRFCSYPGVGNLMIPELGYGIGPCLGAVSDSDNPRVPEKRRVVIT